MEHIHRQPTLSHSHINMKKPSVVFFMPSLEAGGAERVMVNIINNIDRQRYDVSLILAEAKGIFLDEVKKDVPIHVLHISSDAKLFFALAAYLRNNTVDVLVSAFPRINIICIAAKIFSGKNTKIIITEHSVFSLLPKVATTAWRRFFARLFLPWLAMVFYPKADSIICVSEGIKEDLLGIIHCRQKCQVIYNPIINDTISELAKEPLETYPFLSANEPIIICVGRLALRKDYPNLLKAFSLIVHKQPAKLVILGEGPEKDHLVKLASELQISKYITFMGVQANPYKCMARADVFVLSSLVEGFPTVLIEAMVCGVPVVSTNCKSGPSEIIEDGHNGFLVPVQHEKALANAVLKLLADKKLREQFSKEGKKVSKRFSFEKSIEEYQQVFEKVL